jgi:RNA polymerase sigma factor (sigma-70 family)
MVMHQAGRKTAYADLLQAGRIGLWQAILHYEVGRGIAFSSYACVVIRHQVWQLLKQEQKAEGWLEEPEREEALDRVVRVWQQTQIQEALEEELALLPHRLQQVIERHYGLRGTVSQNLAEIGRAWGVTRERIRQLHEQALGLLRLPAFSIRLRGLCERGEREQYRVTLRQYRSWQRARRRRA